MLPQEGMVVYSMLSVAERFDLVSKKGLGTSGNSNLLSNLFYYPQLLLPADHTVFTMVSVWACLCMEANKCNSSCDNADSTFKDSVALMFV